MAFSCVEFGRTTVVYARSGSRRAGSYCAVSEARVMFATLAMYWQKQTCALSAIGFSRVRGQQQSIWRGVCRRDGVGGARAESFGPSKFLFLSRVTCASLRRRAGAT
eukprot:9477897-Pyramimonas_sp.AAC.1